ncbi:MAG: cation transporter [Oscillospiraceae bacterium]
MEYIAGLVVSFIILMLGLNLAQSSFDKILHPQPSSFSLLAVLVLAASILAKLWLAVFGAASARKSTRERCGPRRRTV